MSRTPRRRASSALLRARSRTLFFTALTIVALALGHRLGAGGGAFGAAAGAWTISVAHRRGTSLAHSFAVGDWLLLGLILAVSGGVGSWLVCAIPLLVLAQLLPSERGEWPFLVAPVIVLAIVVAIADPTLGGSRSVGLAKIFVLTLAGIGAAQAVVRGRARGEGQRRRRRVQAVNVDPTTGFYAQARLHELLTLRLEQAQGEHRPLSVACLVVDHFTDTRNFFGAAGAEQIVAVIARRLQHALSSDDLAFRVAPDTFILALDKKTLPEAQAFTETLCHDVSAHLIGRQRQTLRAGVAAYPERRTPQDLLLAAHEAVRRPAPVPAEVGRTVRRREPRLAAAH